MRSTVIFLSMAAAILAGPQAAQAQASGANLSYDENGTFSSPPQATGTDSVAQGSMAAASGSYSTVGGGIINTAGAGSSATVGGGFINTASGGSSTVSGGSGNVASGSSSTIAGGSGNTAGGEYSAIAGGDGNDAEANRSTIAGGNNNVVQVEYGFIGGGTMNTIGTNATSSTFYPTISGGYDNYAEGTGATVPGGYGNSAVGACSLAAGCQAEALHDGAFVWADTQSGAFPSIQTNEFAIRASNGVRVAGVVRLRPGGNISMGSYTNGLAP